jgi:hypothetical protein
MMPEYHDDRYPSLEDLMIQALKNDFINFISLPFKKAGMIITTFTQLYHDIFDRLMYHLTKGSCFDIESSYDRDR